MPINVQQEERAVGIHVMGPNAADVVQGFAAAMRCGLTKRQLDATVGVRPSSAQVSVSRCLRLSLSPIDVPHRWLCDGKNAALSGSDIN